MNTDIRRKLSSARAAAAAVAFALAVLASGCAGPNAPSPNAAHPLPPSAPPAVELGPSIAVLEVAEFRAGPGHDVQLVLVETSGLSGATFGTPLLRAPGGNTDGGCPQLHRVGPGGRWDMDASMSYCAPVGDGSRAGMTVIVQYTDDAGRRGTLTATMQEVQ